MSVSWSETAPSDEEIVGWSDFSTGDVTWETAWKGTSRRYYFGIQAHSRITRLTDNRLCVQVDARIACGSGWAAGNTASITLVLNGEDGPTILCAYGDTAAHTAATRYAYLPSTYTDATVAAGERFTDTVTVTLTVPDRIAIEEKGMQAYVNVNGSWVKATPYVNVNGSWKKVTPKVNIDGTWK